MTASYICAECGATKDSKRQPRGWSTRGESLLCQICLKGAWSTRAITMPVAEVIDPPLGESETFFSRFSSAWRISTDLANWCARELLRHDVTRTPAMEQLPAYAPINLYRRWNETTGGTSLAEWQGCSGAAADIIRAVEQTWRNHPRFGRYAVIWRGEASAATYRWPYPWPIRKQDVRLGWLDGPGGKRPTISIPLPGGRTILQLDNGSGHRRPIKDFAAIVDGGASIRQCKIVGRRKGGKLVGIDVRIVASFRRKAVAEVGKTATIRTDARNLLVVEVEGRDSFLLPFPQLPAAIMRYELFRARLALGMKYEMRWPAKVRRRIVKAGGPAADKQDRRITSLIQQAAAAAVNYCRRNGVSLVVYDDAERDYCEPFRWHALRERLRCKCEEGGIRFGDQTPNEVATA